MKHYLWILNTWLLILCILAIAINTLLRKEPPLYRPKPASSETTQARVPLTINLEKIYQNDLFNTFVIPKQHAEKTSQLSPIPQLVSPAFSPPPPPPPPAFLSPLSITVKGIILSLDDQKSVAMIADETGKEGVFHLGERIKDAQIIKISRNRLVLLRSNGQQEVLYLRKEDNNLNQPTAERWKYAIKKIDDTHFEIEPDEFKREITSLGELIETLQISTAYKVGAPIGIKVGSLDPNEIGPVLGLQKNDIITSINAIRTNDAKGRLQIFNQITALKLGETVQVQLTRNNTPMTITYHMKEIERPLKAMFTSPTQTEQSSQAAHQAGTLFSMSPEQEREHTVRTFEETHKEDHEQTLADLRKRLLENMKIRSKNMRVQ